MLRINISNYQYSWVVTKFCIFRQNTIFFNRKKKQENYLNTKMYCKITNDSILCFQFEDNIFIRGCSLFLKKKLNKNFTTHKTVRHVYMCI